METNCFTLFQSIMMDKHPLFLAVLEKHCLITSVNVSYYGLIFLVYRNTVALGTWNSKCFPIYTKKGEEGWVKGGWGGLMEGRNMYEECCVIFWFCSEK